MDKGWGYSMTLFVVSALGMWVHILPHNTVALRPTTSICLQRRSMHMSSSSGRGVKGKILVLGGTGFLGQAVCKRAIVDGYSVVSISRRGLPPPPSSSLSDQSPGSSSTATTTISTIDYRQGDARKMDVVSNILQEGGFSAVVHCIGLLFDDASGVGNLNRFVSGSGSLPDAQSTYDTITRLTAFNAIDATMSYAQSAGQTSFPFVFVSAAEAGWPDVTGGPIMDRLAPDFLRRYLAAKRVVEARLSQSSTQPTLRPIIVRPSLIYSMDRPASYVPVAAFFLANKVGLPFVDRPVTVQSLSAAIVRAIGDPTVQGVLRYTDIDRLSESNSSAA